jgi:hypothetical protein
MTNPHNDSAAAEHFNSSAHRLWVLLVDLQEICEAFQHHAYSGCPKEHIVAEAARLLGQAPEDPLSSKEWTALEGKRTPVGIVI